MNCLLPAYQNQRIYWVTWRSASQSWNCRVMLSKPSHSSVSATAVRGPKHKVQRVRSWASGWRRFWILLVKKEKKKADEKWMFHLCSSLAEINTKLSSVVSGQVKFRKPAQIPLPQINDKIWMCSPYNHVILAKSSGKWCIQAFRWRPVFTGICCELQEGTYIIRPQNIHWLHLGK